MLAVSRSKRSTRPLLSWARNRLMFVSGCPELLRGWLAQAKSDPYGKIAVAGIGWECPGHVH